MVSVKAPIVEFIFDRKYVGFWMGNERSSEGEVAFELDNDGVIDVFGRVDAKLVNPGGCRCVKIKRSLNVVSLDEKFKPQMRKINRWLFGGKEMQLREFDKEDVNSLSHAQHLFSSNLSYAIKMKQAFMSAAYGEGATVTYLRDKGRFQLKGGKTGDTFEFEYHEPEGSSAFVRVLAAGPKKINILLYGVNVRFLNKLWPQMSDTYKEQTQREL